MKNKSITGRGIKGFTLIELLVVISVIALLMAILMPALAQVRTQAKDVKCRANLKQWGLIFSMYCDNNNSYFMFGNYDLQQPVTGYMSYTWIWCLKPYYMEYGGINFCPEAPITFSEAGRFGQHIGWDNAMTTLSWPDGGVGSYGHNAHAANPPGADDNYWKSPNMKNAYEAPVFTCAKWPMSWMHDEDIDEPPEYADRPPNGHQNGINLFCVARHNGNQNVLFADWNVKSLSAKCLWKLKWHRSFDTTGWMGTFYGAPGQWPPWMANFRSCNL